MPAAPIRHPIGWKTAITTTVVIVSNAAGNYAISLGMHQVGQLVTWWPGPYIRAFSNSWVTAGVLFMLLWVGSRLALLSWADLSYVLPVTSFSYVLSAALGRVLLNERVSAVRWLGIIVLTVGVALVAITNPHTADADDIADIGKELSA
jgi:drug/metabolite transporter (DMT)-like permease